MLGGCPLAEGRFARPPFQEDASQCSVAEKKSRLREEIPDEWLAKKGRESTDSQRTVR